MMLEYDHLFIGNRWVTPATASVLEVRSPATLALVGRPPDGSPDDMDRAVLAARDAFDAGPWPTLSFAQRVRARDVLAPTWVGSVPSPPSVCIAMSTSSCGVSNLGMTVRSRCTRAHLRRALG